MDKKNIYVEEYVKNNLTTPKQVLDFLMMRSNAYSGYKNNVGDISLEKKEYLSINGQNPYAVIITCSDSRVPAEHIFHAGVGELFVIRTAGNVIGDYEIGSIEYGVEHLKAKAILVLGHTQCGAINAALNSKPTGYIKRITDEILNNIPKGCSCKEAEILNVKHSIGCIIKSKEIKHLIDEKKIIIAGAIYNIATGKVELV